MGRGTHGEFILENESFDVRVQLFFACKSKAAGLE
jgi:hypothetical protein